MASLSSSMRTKVDIRISCDGLKDKDVFSKSDPLVAVYSWNKAKVWTELARTERIKNSLNPHFIKVIELDYAFEEVQKLRFSVFDIDNESSTLGDDDFLGSMECSLGEIVSDSPYTRPLKIRGKEAGTITVTAEEQSGVQNMIEMAFSGRGLDKKDLFGKSDPYLEFSKENPDGNYTVVHRTEVIKNNLNPYWTTFGINSHSLCSNDENRTIRVRCFDWDANGSHDLIGEFSTNFNQLSTAHSQHQKIDWKLINHKKQEKKKSYTDSGTILLESIKISRMYSFLDYIMSGCQINFTMGVDFTASNGDPSQHSSLHYISPSIPNEYMMALTTVGEVCQDYDTDKLFPAFGFGAQVRGVVSHEFPLNDNPANPYCVGIQGVLEAYKQSIQTVRLYGPTNMAPIINHVTNFAEASAAKGDYQNYYILLILTDGEITDMPATKKAVVRASHLAMSIIIVGVGDCSFEKMVELDGDDGRLKAGSQYVARDIVQFVPFRKYISSAGGEYALAQAVLAEVPQQLTQYMKLKGVVPRNARP